MSRWQRCARIPKTHLQRACGPTRTSSLKIRAGLYKIGPTHLGRRFKATSESLMKRLFTIFLALSFLTTVVSVSFGQTTIGSTDKNPKEKNKSKQDTSKEEHSGKAKGKSHKG